MSVHVAIEWAEYLALVDQQLRAMGEARPPSEAEQRAHLHRAYALEQGPRHAAGLVYVARHQEDLER